MNFFIGQIGIYGFNFAPKYWSFCAGNILSIAQNTALFSLLGTTYGGNGQTTFALPDLRSRTPVGFDGNYPLGEMAGIENVNLISTQMPIHTHLMSATSQNGTNLKMDGHIFAQGKTPNMPVMNYPAYGPPSSAVGLNAQSVSFAGGNQGHSNIQPSLAVNFCIALTGIFPSRN